jgi:hypothetical protein
MLDQIQIFYPVLISIGTAFLVEILLIFQPHTKNPAVNVKSNDVHKAVLKRCVEKYDEWSAAVSSRIETDDEMNEFIIIRSKLE